MTEWLLAAAALLSVFILAARIGSAEAHIVEHIDRQVNHLERFIMSTQQDAVNAVAAKIRKGTQEVLGRIADLQEQVDAGVPSEDLDLSELTAAAEALDDIVPDAPAPAEPVADEPVTEPADEPVIDAAPEN